MPVDYFKGQAMLVGYARNSGASQSLEIQLRLLSDAGCAKIFSEPEGGAPTGARGALQGALDFVRQGDTLVVIQLDRLARSPNDIHGIIESLADSGVSVRCLQQPRIKPDRRELASLAIPSAVAA